jgi:hypothetical protein
MMAKSQRAADTISIKISSRIPGMLISLKQREKRPLRLLPV